MFTAEEKKFINSLGLSLDFDNLSDDDYVEIEDLVGDKLMFSGLDDNYHPNKIGVMCESILDKVSEV